VRTVEVLGFSGCPNVVPTVQLVWSVARELGVTIEVRQVAVDDAGVAAHLQFPGSPTVRVDGVDIQPLSAIGDAYAMTCRMYGNSGVPSRDAIASALTKVTP
jgi:hypothetical protein